MSLNDFIAKFTNVSGVGNTAANVGQCVGLVEVWFAMLLDPQVWGNAIDLYNNAPTSAYIKATAWPAPAGAAVTFGAPFGHLPDGTYAGHTGISLGDARIFQQNDPEGSTPHIKNYGGSRPNGYIGYILPKNFNANPEGEQDVIDNATALRLAFYVYGFNGTNGKPNAFDDGPGTATTLKQFAPLIGQPTSTVLQQMADDQYGQAYKNEVLLPALTETSDLQNQITTLKAELGQKVDSDPNSIVITQKGWAALFTAVKSFFGNNN